jgi:putative DNA primase/helicase
VTAEILSFAPADLTDIDQWVLWRYEEVNGRRAKIPYQPNGKKASSTDLTTWNEYATVFERWQKYPNVYSGIGFVFSEHDPYCGIDLDKSLDTDGHVKPWARDITERFHDTYSEISPSGTGIKIWSKGSVPKGAALDVSEGGRVEIYSTGRYFTVTGTSSATLRTKSRTMQPMYGCCTKGSPDGPGRGTKFHRTAKFPMARGIRRWRQSAVLFGGAVCATRP